MLGATRLCLCLLGPSITHSLTPTTPPPAPQIQKNNTFRSQKKPAATLSALRIGWPIERITLLHPKSPQSRSPKTAIPPKWCLTAHHQPRSPHSRPGRRSDASAMAGSRKSPNKRSWTTWNWSVCLFLAVLCVCMCVCVRACACACVRVADLSCCPVCSQRKKPKAPCSVHATVACAQAAHRDADQSDPQEAMDPDDGRIACPG